MARRVVVRPRTAAVLSALVVGTGALHAMASPASATFVAPGSHGPADFGDRIPYQLSGVGCAGEQVQVVVKTGAGRVVAGAVSRARVDPLAIERHRCAGFALVPAERRIRATGWAAGDALDMVLTTRHAKVPLRYNRVEVEYGKAVKGTPTVAISSDKRSGPRDRAVTMATGDVVSIGRVDLTDIYSVSLRTCIDLPKPHAPVMFELRAGSPDGPAVVGPIDIADDVLNNNKAYFGWPDCWILQPWPITHQVPARAPHLFLAVIAGEPIRFSSIDFNGTGAKLPDTPPSDLRGMKTLFNGSSFRGWSQTGCGLADGALRTVDHVNGCRMEYQPKKFHNVLVRLEYRQQDFAAHGGTEVGETVHMREAGEYLMGGLFGDLTREVTIGWATPKAVDYGGGYPAHRIKTNSWPQWSQMEIVQRGARYIVRINGRTVTDTLSAAGDPGPFTLAVRTEPQFSLRYTAEVRSDTLTWNPSLSSLDDIGNFWFKNIRVYECRSLKDPACTSGPGLTG